MKANELRIGNLVSFENADFNICKVSSIYITHFNAVNISTRIDYGDSLRTIYKPIPLTEEWLLKLNFTEVFEGHFESPNEMIIVSFNPLKVSIICPMPWIEVEDCQFVHELQNLHFALSKTEISFDI